MKPPSSDRKLDRTIHQATQPQTQTPRSLTPNPTPKTLTTMGRHITPPTPSPMQKHGPSRRRHHHLTPNRINPHLRQRITHLLRTTTLSPVIGPSITNPPNPNLRHPPQKHRRKPPSSQRLSHHNHHPSLHPLSSVPSLNLPELRRPSLRYRPPCQTHPLLHLARI